MDYTEPTLDTWTSIFLLVAGQGFFLAFLLFSTLRRQERANLWLGLLILIFALTLVDYVGYWTNYNHQFPRFAGIYEPLAFLIGPLLYVYLKELGTTRYALKKIAPHFIPFLLVLLYRLPFLAMPSAEKVKVLQGNIAEVSGVFLLPYNFSMFVGLCVLHLAIYSFLIYTLWIKDSLRKDPENQRAIIKNKWQKLLWQLYTAFAASYFLYFVVVQTRWFNRVHDYYIALTMTLFVYTVGYLGYRKPAIFRGRMLERVFLPNKYQHSSLTNSAASSLLKKLLHHMQTRQPYLENEFRLTDLAEQLGASTHHLSQVINENLNKNFSDFVNTYRVEEAKRLLADPQAKSRYIIDIAYASGFNNKTTFNKAFKEQTGMSPSVFRKKQQSGQRPQAIAG